MSTVGRFAGKVAVVTGAASGLGRASARRLAEEGANVVAVDIDADAVAALAEELPTRSIAVGGDVSSEADVDAYLRAGVDTFGRVDLHHLNAGIFGSFATLPDLDVADFERVMAVNVRGPLLGLRAAFRHWRSTGERGTIALTASIASLTGAADLVPYQVSKHAVTGLVRSAAVYGGPLGIRVNAVAPGIVPTELFRDAASATGGKNDMAQRASTAPLRRAGQAEEIAGVVAFLLSEDSSYLTGQLVAADGGASVVNTVRPSGGAGAWDTEAVDAPLYQGWDR
ncbi:NAD(P)-dependent dehydrogenase (short-subunit alcohol dehydrogenase family) [Tamaricihabitans halophyticus]|uniref:NAD(P)-dependent dehydrogenase (Short-subunit alcohol dehydrogenase family) n=1 Tax=Tamaricihabitans halophyticus TaxID=1262583 RepID=A0A4R2QVG4_9PSEU|nr:SDR family oxidoreductase [Tamaricihabitans halophyticus]TCP53069.1 NAD(P)-dependent dehydrogenase (short-subunit alcohol dehydrogenase family) [Tamaricihabitans halophyticus]